MFFHNLCPKLWNKTSESNVIFCNINSCYLLLLLLVLCAGMTNAEVLHQVEHGYRMPCPPSCPQALYEIMLDCWAKDEMERPTFETLQWKLEEFFVMPASEYTDATIAVR